MHVRMKTHISGFRNGVEWPDKGTVIEIRDSEAADLIAAGYAEEAPDAPATFIAPDTFADPAGGPVYEPAEAAADEPEPVDADPLAGVTLDAEATEPGDAEPVDDVTPEATETKKSRARRGA